MPELISHNTLLAMLHYDAEVGAFYRKTGEGFRKVGSRAGQLQSCGHRRIMIKRRFYQEHRLAWFYVHSEWPQGLIDHINGDAADNRIANLRVVTHAQNSWNRVKKRSSKSGHRGVVRNHHKWIARIKHRNVIRSLGSFDTKEEACRAFDEAEAALRGEFLPGAVVVSVRPAVPESIKISKRELTVGILRDMLAYDVDTGLFRWKIGFARAPIGGVAGKASNGYVQIGALGRLYYAHRLAWFYVHGAMPKGEVDHINGDGIDNRISNLREVTRKQNLANTRVHSSTASGLKGVSRSRKRWAAQICADGVRKHLGTFDTPEKAHAAYAAAARELFGEFARP